MNVEITLKRGGIPITSWDPEFLAKLEAFLEANPKEGEVKGNSLYKRLIRAQKELISTVSKVLGDEAKEPFTITVKIEGRPKVYPPGPKNY